MLIPLELISYTPVINRTNNIPFNDFILTNSLEFYSPSVNCSVKISKANFLYILDNATLKKKAIQEYMIISFSENKYYLFIEGTQEYEACLNSQKDKVKLSEGYLFSIYFKYTPTFLQKNFNYQDFTAEDNIVDGVFCGTFYRNKLKVNNSWKTIDDLDTYEEIFVFHSFIYGFFYFKKRKSFSLISKEKSNSLDFLSMQNRQESLECIQFIQNDKDGIFSYFFKKSEILPSRDSLNDWLTPFSPYGIPTYEEVIELLLNTDLTNT